MRKKLILIALTFSIILNGVFIYVYSKSFYKKIKAIALNDNPTQSTDILKNLVYHDAQDFAILGRYHNEPNYNRLPIKYKDIVRKEVWNLSNNSSGLSIIFRTNSSNIGIRWKVKKNSTPSNMTKISANGIDLYCLKDGQWQYVNSGIPTGFESESLIISDMDTTHKDFMLNLPLYDITENIEIGVQSNASIKKNELIRNTNSKPIVFYGTSITQGGSASRPGMNYPSIISRNLNTEIINLGFSGNGRFEYSIGVALCDIDSKLIVLDCTPNSHPDTIQNNVPKLLRQLRQCKPQTPILIIESITREYAHFKISDSNVFGSYKFIERQNSELRKAYVNAENEGIKNIYYLESANLIGIDHEGTVDGTHLNDLGLSRIASKVQTKILEILDKE